MTSCRTCRSSRLYLFLELGDHPLANGFLTEEQLSEPEAAFALDVYACLDCGLIQVRDNVPPEYFRHYVYVPGASPAMHEHFDAFAEAVSSRFLDSSDGLTVDIGCNDGLFLSSLQSRGKRTLGIDPATNIVEVTREKGVEVVDEYFTPELARSLRSERGPARVIVTTNTFHHIDDLDSFTQGVTELLDDDGVFIVEVPHALELVEQNEFDGVYHEHVSQMTVKSFVDLYQRFDLEVFDVEPLDVHGGSMRVFARRSNGGDPTPVVQEWVGQERERGLFEAATYDAFRGRVESNRKTLLELLQRLKQEGARIVGYGASARGNTLLNYFGIGTDYLDYIADRNPLKQGLYSPGMHIPVVDAAHLEDDRPEYVLIIAWNFAREVVAQQDAYRRAGGKFIVPIPEPMILEDFAGA